MSAVIDVGEASEGAARIAGRTNKNGNYCNLLAVGGQLGGPAVLLAPAVSNIGGYREIIFSGGLFL